MHAPFLLSSWTDLTDTPRLDGFAWDGTDFVNGSEGLAAFETARRRALAPGADGVHILCRPTRDGAAMSADSAGYRHLFHWSDGRRWAVGEALIDLVAHLRSHGVDLEENRAQIGAFLSRKQLFQQLTTRETPVAGIDVLLPSERIEIDGDGLSVRQIDRSGATGYESALRAFLETWLGRIETLLTEPELRLFFHLSGGVDSRAAAAFLVWLRRNRDLPDRATLHSLTDARHAADLAVARTVAAAAGLGLNGLEPRPRSLLGEEGSLRLWRTQSAGAYSPVRLMGGISDPRDLHFTGHGGGGYKANLAATEVDRAIAGMERAYSYFGKGDKAAWRRALEETLTALTPERGEAWTRLQRVSRARFHGGQAASYKRQVALFDSRLAADAADARPPASRRGTQFHFDILANLAPDLLDLPFDSAKKAPDEAQRAALTRVSGLSPEAGDVFGPLRAESGLPKEPGAPLAALVAEVDAGWGDLPKGRVTRLFRFHLWRLSRAVRRGKRPDAVELRHLHAAWLMIRLSQLGVRFEE